MSEIKSFTKVRKPIQFEIDNDVFDASPAVPAQVMLDFMGQITSADPTSMSPQQQINLLMGVLEIVLLPQSLARFKARMSSVQEPIEMDQVNDVVMWLFEEYGLRPTTESVSSASGGAPPVPGITSMASTLPQGLISASSL